MQENKSANSGCSESTHAGKVIYVSCAHLSYGCHEGYGGQPQLEESSSNQSRCVVYPSCLLDHRLSQHISLRTGGESGRKDQVSTANKISFRNEPFRTIRFDGS
jgi:hypothetical protein